MILLTVLVLGLMAIVTIVLYYVAVFLKKVIEFGESE